MYIIEWQYVFQPEKTHCWVKLSLDQTGLMSTQQSTIDSDNSLLTCNQYQVILVDFGMADRFPSEQAMKIKDKLNMNKKPNCLPKESQKVIIYHFC